MTKYLAKRLLLLVLVLLGIVLFVSSLTYLVPGDPATIMLQQKAFPEIKAMAQQKLGLDLPVLVRLGRYLRNILHGTFGYCIMSGRPVLPEVLSAMPYTFVLATFGMAVSLLFRAGLGIISIYYKANG